MEETPNEQNGASPAEAEQQDILQTTIDLLQRTQANFENYRKQAEKRLVDMKQMAARDLILQLLPILDHFDLALKNTQNIDKTFLQGMELIYAELNALLENNGIKPIQTQGQTFDPYRHEALMKVTSDLPENTIIEEIQRGYTLYDVVIRHAKVKISAGKEE